MLARSGPSSFDIEGWELLRFAEIALRTGVVQPATSARQFSFDLGVVAPLSLLVVKTSEPDIRQGAMDLLYLAQNRQEGMYDGSSSLRFALRAVESSSLSRLGVTVGDPPSEPVPLEWAIAQRVQSGESRDEPMGHLITALGAI